jgi:hypothetical protein
MNLYMIRFQDLQENVRSHEFQTNVQENQTHEIKFQETLDLIKITLFKIQFTTCDVDVDLSKAQEALIPLLGNRGSNPVKNRIKTFELCSGKTKIKFPKRMIHVFR